MALFHFLLLSVIISKSLGQTDTKNTSAQDTVNTYGLYNNCPDGSYYGDMPGIDIYCEPHPWPASKHELCWRDLWGKSYLETDDFRRAGISNPFDILGADGCKAKCLCKLSMDMSLFLCTEKGARLGWNRSPPPFMKYRPVFHCEEFSLPDIFSTLPTNGSIELVISINNFPPTSTQLQSDMEAHYNMSKSILNTGFPVNGWIINTTSAQGQKATTFDFAQSFLYNLSFPKVLHRLDLINFNFDPQQPENTLLQFPDLDLILSNMTSSVELLKLDGFSVTTIPDRVPPPFINSLKAIIVRNSPTFVRFPSWLANAKSLAILILDRVSPAFVWDGLSSVPTLKYFCFTNTPVTNLPAKVALASLFPQLEYLDLSNMNMGTIRKDLLTGMSSLRYLDLSGNDLSTVPSLAGLIRLESLSLAGIRPSTKRRSQECMYGQSRRLSFGLADLTDLTNLISLDISNYEMVNVSDDALTRATKLEIASASCVGWNQIPAAFRYGCRLRELRLASNLLNTPDSIPSFVATELTDLTHLDLRNNTMATLPQTLLSFSKTNYDLIDWIRTIIRGNPLNGSTCEIRRFETAYGLDSSISGNSSGSTCNAGDVGGNRGATVKMCKPAEPRAIPKIVIKAGGRAIGSVLAVLMAVVMTFW